MPEKICGSSNSYFPMVDLKMWTFVEMSWIDQKCYLAIEHLTLTLINIELMIKNDIDTVCSRKHWK